VLVPGCDFTLEPTITECHDLNYVVALDESPLDGSPREGAHSTPLLTAVRATTKPNQPPTLSASADDDSVVLSWGAAPGPSSPYTGSDVIFYRVYQDGTGIDDRIARTSQDSLLSYRDNGALAGGHEYYVTAVDENFSESAPLGPVSVP
jgi:hypothetical protein